MFGKALKPREFIISRTAQATYLSHFVAGILLTRCRIWAYNKVPSSVYNATKCGWTVLRLLVKKLTKGDSTMTQLFTTHFRRWWAGWGVIRLYLSQYRFIYKGYEFYHFVRLNSYRYTYPW
jgi:hypothetical protein